MAEYRPLKLMTHDEADRLFGSDRDCQCGRCGSSMDFIDCDVCGGEGHIDVDDDERTVSTAEWCYQCDGDGSWPVCISTADYCEANPLPGREDVKRHTVEWFEIVDPR